MLVLTWLVTVYFLTVYLQSILVKVALNLTYIIQY
ncbi:MAG: hypothetical protein JWP00_2845 [Chloroflexi bacterium]|nr:hypothetical protein [Chloroflexota bacterium]